MEFRYRAIDNDRPPPSSDTTTPTQPPNPTVSVLSPQTMPGENEIHVGEAMQREIEKELIRQEIIIAEASRKRELIAEVLQEMAIERELAKRRVTVTETTRTSLEDKLIMWINQKNLLPNQNNLFGQKSTSVLDHVTSPMIQTSPLHQIHEATTGTSSVMESNKEKLILLERADAAIGEKRKAEDYTQTGLERAKRKAAEPMSVETGDVVSSKIPCMRKLGSTGKQGLSKISSRFKFWCETCKVGAFTPTVMRNHKLGKKHMAAIAQHKEPTSLAPALTQSETVAVLSGNETMGEKTEGEKNNEATLWCQICNIWTNSDKMMETHKLGKKHKKSLFEEQQIKTQSVLDTKLITVPVVSLNTDTGDEGSVVDHTNGKVLIA